MEDDLIYVFKLKYFCKWKTPLGQHLEKKLFQMEYSNKARLDAETGKKRTSWG